MISRRELNRELAEQVPEGVSQAQYRQVQKYEKFVQAQRLRGKVVAPLAKVGPVLVGNRAQRRKKK